MATLTISRQTGSGGDQASAQYLERFFGVRWDDPLLYHMVLNTGKWELEAAAQLIAEALRRV
jgi:cytidylate kinase